MHPHQNAALSVDEIRAGLRAAAPGDYAVTGGFRRGGFVLTDALRLHGRVVAEAAGNLIAVDAAELETLTRVRSYAIQLLSWHDWLVTQLRTCREPVTYVNGCTCCMCLVLIKEYKEDPQKGTCEFCGLDPYACLHALCHVNLCQQLQ